MQLFLLKILINIRWQYFHLHPHYLKFSMSSNSNECHFQHAKTGGIHSNIIIADNKPNCDSEEHF
jgi:hypothetical protein